MDKFQFLCVCYAQWIPVVSDSSVTPLTISTSPLSIPGKNTEEFPDILQGIFPTQGIQPVSERLPKSCLEQFFAQKDSRFTGRWDCEGAQKWQNVVEQNGEYFVE